MRLFIAVPFPEEIKQQIDRVEQAVQSRAKQGRFVPMANHHITLLFLGEQKNGKAAIAAMEQVQSTAFSLTLSGLGKFRNSGGAIVWMGVQPSQKLEWIHSQLTAALPEMQTDQRFRPHVTLGRQVILQGDLQEIVVPDILVPVERIVLMESTRESGKPVYVQRYEKRLTAQ